MRKRSIRIVQWLLDQLWLLVTFALIIVAVYVVTARQALNYLPEWRSNIEQLVLDKAQQTIRIGELKGELEWFSPVAVAHDVEIEYDGKAWLSVPKLTIKLDLLRSLVSRKPSFQRIVVEGVHAQLEKNELGQWVVQGRVFDTSPKPVNSAAVSTDSSERFEKVLTLLHQQNIIAFKKITVSLNVPDIPITSLSDINITLSNVGSDHRIAGSVFIDGVSSSHFTFGTRYSGLPDSLEAFRLSSYLRLHDTDVSPWLNDYLPELYQLDSSVGGAEVWVNSTGLSVESAQFNFGFDTINAIYNDQPLSTIDDLALQANLMRIPNGWDVSIHNLEASFEGLLWPRAQARFVWEEQSDASSLNAYMSHISIDMLSAFAAVLPEQQQALKDQVLGLSPTGTLRDLVVQANKELDLPWHYSGQVLAANVSTQEYKKIPGIQRLTTKVWFQPSAAAININSADATLGLQRLFPEDITLDKLSGDFIWNKKNDGAWSLRSNILQLKNLDAQGEAVLSVYGEPGNIPELQLLATIDNGRADATPKYLPAKLKGGLRTWLDEAFISGKLTEGSFLYHGPVKVPLDQRWLRSFLMRFALNDAQLKFQPDWPLLEQVEAVAFINDRALEVNVANAELLGINVTEGLVTLPPVKQGEPLHLLVDTPLFGSVTTALSVLQDTPLNKLLPETVMSWKGQGPLSGELVLDIPIMPAGTPADRKLPLLANVDLTLQDGQLSTGELRLDISEIDGDLGFDSKTGFWAYKLDANVFGESVVVDINTSRQGQQVTTAIETKLNVPFAPVATWLQQPFSTLISGRLESDVRIEINNIGDDFVLLESSLKGIALDLPAPLTKQADEEFASTIKYVFSVPHKLSVSYGDKASAWLLLSEDIGVARGHVRLGRGLARERTQGGLVIDGAAKHLNVESWLDTIEHLSEQYTKSSSSDNEAGSSLRDNFERLNIKVSQLDIYDYVVSNPWLQIGRYQKAWQVGIDSTQVKGSVTVPDQFTQHGQVPMVVDLEYLLLAGDEGSSQSNSHNSLSSDLNPNDMFPLNFSSDRIAVGEDEYGQWSFAALPKNNMVEFTDVQGRYRHLDIQAKGQWWREDGRDLNSFSGNASGQDLAQILEAWGVAESIQSESLSINFDLDWPGAPIDLDYQTAVGDMSMDIRNGRIISVDSRASALKVMGVFNVKTWQRRLKGEFDDLYKKGLAFDSILGDTTLNNGVLNTSNLRLKGPSARVDISGSADLVDETFNHSVDVALPVSKNMLAGCLLGLPTCAGLVVFDRLLGDKLEEFSTLSYHLGGTWQEPLFEEITSSAPNTEVSDADASVSDSDDEDYD